jgi:hypothetical protein
MKVFRQDFAGYLRIADERIFLEGRECQLA